ncbi:phosphate acyltransferase PlsX [Pilimelia columellifera]|uniref:phosphate acyltransferase PlsX n=1 Tax=Pilimelia columellifera TaxID=706574 RepID=UPI0031D99E3E
MTSTSTTSPGPVRIALDLLGGDDAPAVVVDGAVRACAADPDLRLLLVGSVGLLDEAVRAFPASAHGRLTLRPARGAVGMADAPSRGSRADTSVRGAVNAVVEGVADAVVSAGASGASVTAAALGLGRLPGVRRPALAATLPAAAGSLVLLDVGGSLDHSPATLLRHAQLGAAYAAAVRPDVPPRVGLLSIGVEPGKGDRSRRLAAVALAKAPLPAGAGYVGLVEGHEVGLGSRANVVVTDGFTGNILLKGVEGAYAMAGAPHPAPAAAPLLGVNGVVVVCHGAADGADIASGIALAAALARDGVVARLTSLLPEPVEATG